MKLEILENPRIKNLFRATDIQTERFVNSSHLWKTDKDGMVDYYVWIRGPHVGVECEICHKAFCIYCFEVVGECTG